MHPGELLEETLYEINMSSGELAVEINKTKETIDKIMSGQMGVGSGVASALEMC